MRDPHRGLLVIALVYVLLAASIATVISGGSLAGTVSGALAGCTLEIGGSEVRLPVDGAGVSCWQRVDVVTQLVTGVGAASLWLLAAWVLGRRGRAMHRTVPLGLLATVASGLIPLATVVWLVDFYRLTPGPVEVGVGVVPLVWAVISAGIVFRAYRAQGTRSEPRTAR